MKSMRVTRAQLLPLFLLLVCLFGCKGAGGFVRVLGAVAVTTVRVAALAGAAAAAHSHHVHVRETEEDQRRAAEAAAYADQEQRAGNCTEVLVEVVPPPPPGSPPPPRGFDCGGRVLLRNDEGSWRDYDPASEPAVVPP